jgi:membrane protein implicated in regulation of membrane protease activity
MFQTDALSLVFIGSFLFGLLFLLITAFAGAGHGHAVAHHMHVDMHVHHSAAVQGHHASAGTNDHFSLFAFLNPTTVIFFLLGFGLCGYIFHTVSLALPLTLILALVSGLVFAILLLMLISRVFGSEDVETVQDVSDRTGLLGKVIMTIQPNALGEILYVSPGGMRKSIPARSISGQRLERDQEVVVVNYQQGIAEVDTWDHFINEEASDEIPPYESPNASDLRRLLEDQPAHDTQNM